MAKLVNLAALTEQEAQAQAKRERLQEQLKRLRSMRHQGEKRALNQRIRALGLLVHELYPDKTVTEIATLLRRKATPPGNGVAKVLASTEEESHA